MMVTIATRYFNDQQRIARGKTLISNLKGFAASTVGLVNE